MEDNKSYKIQILKWTCIGLVIRLILMCCTMHGQDLFFINYFPMKFLKEGLWDPYGFIGTNFSFILVTYYGPVVFILMSIANWIFINCFNAVSLVKILELAGTMMFKEFTIVDYVHAFSKLDLFKNLFLMKSPYLVFDFLIGAILLKLALSRKLALASYKLWMLNIVVLHSEYMIGQIDLIPAFFIIASLYAAVKKRPYLAIASLSLGGAAKLFPYILILPACLLLGCNWKKKLSLLFTAGALSILIYLPFYLSSGNSVLKFFTVVRSVEYPGPARWLLIGIFATLYSFISINAIKDSRQPEPERKLLFYFLTLSLLTYAVTTLRLRFFVFVTPLLALILPRNKKICILTLFIILMMVFLTLHNRYLQWGLFAPLNPEYFISLPSIQEIVGRFVNIEIVYKIMARVLILCFLIAAWWTWRMKLNTEIRGQNGFCPIK